jgi:hypothetical protein
VPKRLRAITAFLSVANFENQLHAHRIAEAGMGCAQASTPQPNSATQPFAERRKRVYWALYEGLSRNNGCGSVHIVLVGICPRLPKYERPAKKGQQPFGRGSGEA